MIITGTPDSIEDWDFSDLLVALSHEHGHEGAWDELHRRNKVLGELSTQLLDAKRNEERAVGELNAEAGELHAKLRESVAESMDLLRIIISLKSQIDDLSPAKGGES